MLSSLKNKKLNSIFSSHLRSWNVETLGNIRAWAVGSEQAKVEEAEAQAMTATMVVKPQRFPSLKEAVNSKPNKKKGTTITLSEFNHGGFDQGHMRPEMHTLPTGPKELSTEEMQFNRLGGDFSSYD
ncbi:Eukaryotic translation initiation factor 4B1 [Glycine soja]